MKFHLGPPPENPDFHPEADGWRSVRMPGPILVQVIAIPVSIVVFVVLIVLLTWMWPNWDLPPEGRSHSLALLIFLLLVVLIPLHEFIHGLAVPKGLRSPHLTFGYWPSRFVPYAYHDAELSRPRLYWFYLAPLTILSILPLLGIGIFRLAMPELSLFSLINAAASTGDIIFSTAVLFQTPSTAVFRGKGWNLYWREGDEVN